MRIALYHNMPSGGAKRNIFDTVSRLARHHDIDVYTLSCAEHDFCDIRPYTENYRIYDFRPLPLLKSPLGRLNQGARLLDIQRLRHLGKTIASDIDSGGYDVALVHPCLFTTSPAILRYLRIPSVYYCHDAVNLRWIYEPPVPRSYDQQHKLRAWLDKVDPLIQWHRQNWMAEDKTNYRAASVVLTNSNFTREALSKIYGVSPYTCYPGVDTRTFSPAPVLREKRVLSVGMLAPAKGFDFVIQSLALVPQKVRPPLTIVGNRQHDAERIYLEQLARQLDVSIDFRLMIGLAELLALYRSSLLTVYAPVREPFGLVPLESMACGTPVIGVDEGGVKEQIVDTRTGRLVKRDTVSFAQAIMDLLENPARAEQMGGQASMYVAESWNGDQAIANLTSYLEKALSTRRTCA